MFEVGVVAHFEAAHQLVGDFGPATRLHGHTYRLEISVCGLQLGIDGTLFDISRLQEATNALVARLHYRNLGDVAGLVGINTTAEHVARFIWQELAPHLSGIGLVSLNVRVWENANAYAAYTNELPA